MTTKQLKDKYLKFFEEKGHKVIPSASLIPENDPTVLFTTAGMHPLVPYLLGEKHPMGDKLVNVQKCIRTSDIDEVGDDWHLTFFEMLGNWGLGSPASTRGGEPTRGGYWKKEAIEMSWEFLFDKKWLGLDKKRISVSVFKGEEGISKDEESAEIWKSLGIKDIKFLGKEDNFWGPAGKTGPCGPCTEMFYNGVEIWNDVFMEYNRRERTILVDGMDCLYDEKFRLNQKLLDILNKIQARKILVINAFGEKAEKLVGQYGIEVFTFEKKIVKEDKKFFEKLFEKYDLKPGEVVYFDHSKENLKGAEDAGIKLVKQFSNNEEEINEFIDKNIFYYTPLKQKNVDTGMGVERTVAILNKAESVYEIEPLKSIIKEIKRIAPDYDERSARIITDHLRASVFILAEGITPSNVERGYVLRRLIRKATEFIRNMGISEEYGFIHIIAKLVINKMQEEYPKLRQNGDFIIEQLITEEKEFNKIDAEAEKIFDDYMRKNGITPLVVTEIGPDGKIPYIANPLILSKVAFRLRSEKGLSLSTIKRLARDKNYVLDEKGLEELEKGLQREFKEHVSRSAISAGRFKSGLADHSEQVTKLHTATHLLLAALRQVLGNHVFQKGSNITAERLRLDFSHSEKMTPEQLKKVEEIVNEQIKKDLAVNCEEMPLEEAKKKEATGVFESKYGDRVKVYSVGPSTGSGQVFSCEICSGPHVQKTGELGHFKIIKEEASSAGVRRIKAILE